MEKFEEYANAVMSGKHNKVSQHSENPLVPIKREPVIISEHRPPKESSLPLITAVIIVGLIFAAIYWLGSKEEKPQTKAVVETTDTIKLASGPFTGESWKNMLCDITNKYGHILGLECHHLYYNDKGKLVYK